MLHGREDELAAIDGLLERARTGASGVLVLRGDPGIGKSALLDTAAERAAVTVPATGVLRARGVEFEAEIPFAGLHLMLRPCLDRLDTLPDPQAAALRRAFGADGAAHHGDRFLVGLAVLTLLGTLAENAPLLCLVDDAHWLDQASSETLAFAARRLDTEGVVLLVATRDSGRGVAAAGLPERRLGPLAAPAAAAVLDARGLDPASRYRILGEAAGNPLALLELPPGASTDALSPAPPLLGQRLRAAFDGRLRDLPAPTRALLLVAALDDTETLDTVLRAAAKLGADVVDLAPAEHAGLLRIAGDTVTFRHSLVRAAVHHDAGHAARVAAHRALADVLDRGDDADRRAWHLAQATTGHDEAVAEALEHTAVRARNRFGVGAAARTYQEAARLSPEPRDRARRLALAADSAADAGELDVVTAVTDAALQEAATDGAAHATLVARLTHARATVYFRTGAFAEAYRLMMESADALGGTDPALALRLLTQGAHAAWYVGATDTRRALDRIAALPLPPADPLVAVTRYLTAALSPAVDRSVDGLPAPAAVFGEVDALLARQPEQLVLVAGAALVAGDDMAVRRLAATLAELARGEGVAGQLPTVLFFQAEAELFLGAPQEAHVLASEALRLADDTGQRHWSGQLQAFLAYLAALRGDEAGCRDLADAALGAGSAAPGRAWTSWALGVLDLGLGRAERAMSRLHELSTHESSRHHVSALRCLPDLVEAAVRAGLPEHAREPLRRLTGWAGHVEQPWLDALRHRCLALVAGGPEAEEHFAAALRVPERPFEHARTQLLFGEWLRRGQRKADARLQLDAAAETLDRLGAVPWAERARAELRAAGAGAPAPATAGPLASLTPQELQIVRLARQGLANKEIAARLFLSPRTVGYHLYKAYPKLGVAGRAELADVLD